MKGHWSRTCRIIKHLIGLYQVLTEKKGKNAKTTLTLQNATRDDDDDHANPEDINVNITHLDVANFFKYIKRRIDHLIGDGVSIRIRNLFLIFLFYILYFQ
jgi:hypothetical protein